MHPLLGTSPLGQKHRGKWCSNNDIQLNVAKTKKTIIDFRTNKTAITTLAIRKQHGSASVHKRTCLQGLLRQPQRSLPSIESVYITHTFCKATTIIFDPTHPANLFESLPSGKRFKSIKTTATCHSKFRPKSSSNQIAQHQIKGIKIFKAP